MNSVVAYLRHHRRFAVVSHVNPDGDSIGSLLAMTLGLRSLGKEVEAFSSDSVPLAYGQLPGVSLVRIARNIEETYDGVLLLECSGAERTGIGISENNPLIIVDHHVSCNPDGCCHWVDARFGSVGQMALRILEALGAFISPDIAVCLYAALLTDTGSFQFNNTTALEFQDAARLTEFGANPEQVAQMVFNANRPGKILLMGKLLSQMFLDSEQRLAWIIMDWETMDSVGALPEDTEGIIQHLMSIHSVQVAAFFKQDGKHSRYRVSLRSKGGWDVSSIAQRFHGGGHRNAAGFTLREEMDSGLPKVLQAMQSLLDPLKDFAQPPSSSLWK